jgi:hypothetical protein
VTVRTDRGEELSLNNREGFLNWLIGSERRYNAITIISKDAVWITSFMLSVKNQSKKSKNKLD